MNNREQPADKSRVKEEILGRARWLYILFVFIGLLIIGRILYIQYGPDGADLRQKATDSRSYKEEKVEAKRGDILSHDGKVLATSIPTYEIRMDFNVEGVTDEVFDSKVDSLARCLSLFFKDKSARDYKDILTNGRRNPEKNRYVLLSPRRVNYLELQEISRFPLFDLGRNKGGFIAVQVNRRVRPNGNLASRTVGMTNEDGVKVGIEGAFDRELKGVDGSTLMQKISGSFWIPVSSKLNREPVNGIDVVSTLDIELQDVAEKMLKEQLESADAIWGTAMLMEVATGEIRAIANLKKQPSGQYIEDYNYGVGMSMEPGSTFKLVSLMAVLDDAGANMNETINTGDGVAMIGKAKVVDSRRGGYGTISLRKAFEVSSNVGFAKTVNKYFGHNPKGFTSYVHQLGIDKPLGLQIPGEGVPIFRQPGDKMWNGLTLTMMSYGYALMIAPIHTLTVFNAVANDGKMMKPLFVKELRQNGQVLQKFEPELLNPRICSPSTLKLVREAMEGVTQQGTAKFLLNHNYTVAAKTGTAQVAKGKYGYNVNGGKYYLATLVGYFPADAPEYTCIIAIETFHGAGSGKIYYGGALAGPVFRAIADKIYARSVDWQRKKMSVGRKEERTDFTTPELQLHAGNIGQTAEVMERLRIGKMPAAAGGYGWMIRDSTSGLKYGNVPEDGVPDVRGMGLRDAVYLMEQRGLTVHVRGRGRVISQSLPAGAFPVKGDAVTLTLKPD